MSNIKKVLAQLTESTQQRIMLGIFITLIILIPSVSLLISQRNFQAAVNDTNARNFNSPVTTGHDGPATTSATLIRETTEQKTAAPSTSATATTAAVSFGPTLNLKITIDGRPASRYATKLFVGLAAGDPTTTPTYLLSFTVDVPDSGIFNDISLAGLTAGTKYTAYLKGSVQLATASAFIMAPGATSLNSGAAMHLLTGDLNQDNIINAADYSIVKAALNTKAGKANWNAEADFNLDGVVNTIDLAILQKNYAKTGMSGTWYSPPPATASATQSASVSSGIGGPKPSGYWFWVPN